MCVREVMLFLSGRSINRKSVGSSGVKDSHYVTVIVAKLLHSESNRSCWAAIRESRKKF